MLINLTDGEALLYHPHLHKRHNQLARHPMRATLLANGLLSGFDHSFVILLLKPGNTDSVQHKPDTHDIIKVPTESTLSL
jgi:hypothetical protein